MFRPYFLGARLAQLHTEATACPALPALPRSQQAQGSALLTAVHFNCFWSIPDTKIILLFVSSVMPFYIFSFLVPYCCCMFIEEQMPQMAIYTNTILTRSAFLIFFNSGQLLLWYNKYIEGRPHVLAFIICTSSVTLLNIVSLFW